MNRIPFTLAVTAALSSATPSGAIVIRHDVPDRRYLAREADFPAVFALYVNRAGHKDCIATLISPDWAVTAAHCTRDAPFLREMAQARPRFRVEIAGRPAFIDRVVRHPQSERRAGGSFREWVDLALVHLDRTVRHVPPVQLHRAGDELGKIVLLPGWGTTGTGANGLAAPDGRFRLAQNKVGGADSGWLFWRFDDPAEGQALALEGISGPGDSGGPALVRGRRGLEILGVGSSQQTRGGREGVYGVVEGYIQVSHFAAWIDQVTGRRTARRRL